MDRTSQSGKYLDRACHADLGLGLGTPGTTAPAPTLDNLQNKDSTTEWAHELEANCIIKLLDNVYDCALKKFYKYRPISRVELK